MPAATQPRLQEGRVYRTEDLARWGKNPSRLARRLVREGNLRPLARGLYTRPRSGHFGAVPPTEGELLRTFLRGGPFLVSGPECWNALGLGSTATFSCQLVYNTKRSGQFDLGGTRFLLRRVPFPRSPTPEWFAVDLVENHDMAGVTLEELERRLKGALSEGRFDPEALRDAAEAYGTSRTRALVERVTGPAAAEA
jgi:hypothetical protein